MKLGKHFAAFVLFVSSLPAMAWGPHTQITDAAVKSLGPDDALVKYLGPSAQRLTSYCWMGDHHGGFQGEPDGSIYYVDDFLLYPGMPRYNAHTCPNVTNGYEPYFRRVIQAMRMETPENAARWMGALLHFTEDSGAPPHALPGMGALHAPMEGWTDPAKIAIPGYQPRLLGATEDEAFAGYKARMEGLIAFSKERAEKIKPLVEANNRPAAEPLIMECALECSRVAADLLYTLGRISIPPVEGGAVLRGTVNPGIIQTVGIPEAKVVLLGTDYSTVTDASGHYEFRNLQPGKYQARVLFGGCAAGRFDVVLPANGVRTINIALPYSEPLGNLIRNPDFLLRWVSPDRPDGWYPGKNSWISDPVRVTAGRKYRVSIKWKPGTTATAYIACYTRGNPVPGWECIKFDMPSTESEHDFTIPEKGQIVQVTIRTSDSVDSVCDRVSLVPVAP